MSRKASTVTRAVCEKSQVLEAYHGIGNGRAIHGNSPFDRRCKDAPGQIRPDLGEHFTDGIRPPGFEPRKDPLHELFEPDKGFVRQKYIIDAIYLIVTEFDIRTVRRAVVMVASDRLDDVVGEIRPGRDQDIDVPPRDQVGDDTPHATGNHRPGEAEEFHGPFVAELPFIDRCGPGKRTGIVGSGTAHFGDEFSHRHSRPDADLLYRFPAFHADDVGFHG